MTGTYRTSGHRALACVAGERRPVTGTYRTSGHRALPAWPGDAEDSQAAVEVALVLPLLVMVLLGLIQVGLVIRDQVLVTHAAREAARAAAVDPGPEAARHAAESGGALDPDRLSVESAGREGPGSRVQVTVRYRVPTRVPMIGPLIGDLRLQAEATMRVE